MDINDANLLVVKHLQELCVQREYKNEHISNMLNTLHNNVNDWPVDKTSRWIGFIQGVMYKDGVLDIDEERDFTRPIFHKVYDNPPDTIKLYK